MSSNRKIEIFSAACSACDETVAMVRRIGCSSCQIEVLDMHDSGVAAKARAYGVRAVPAVAVSPVGAPGTDVELPTMVPLMVYWPTSS